jgi:hypothetical protein
MIPGPEKSLMKKKLANSRNALANPKNFFPPTALLRLLGVFITAKGTVY